MPVNLRPQHGSGCKDSGEQDYEFRFDSAETIVDVKVAVGY
jgi:hypothetical protein